ncbi:uncharacterized protein LOC123505389, partial [Portunus trituberculatus]|uniref:uncharacterized protein LOC123505389 n=1 Tax=Portunus trituberculatus TaxID=210409 RepID=UPI001E1CDE32
RPFGRLAVSLADNGFRKELRVTEDVEGLEEWQLTLLGGQGHLGAALEAGVEAGAVVFSAVLTTLLYRRAFLVAALLLSAALAIAVACVLQLVNEAWMDVTSLATALRFVGVFTVGCARLGLGVVTVEVTPTTSRASAVGLCAAQAAIGEILASFMTVMAKMTYPSVPWLVSAGGCLLAAILTLVLPETSGTTLPDVVDEAEVVGLAISGQVIKSCYAKYGRTPYWTELDGEASGENHQGSHCHNKPRRYTKRSEASFFSTTEEHNEVEIKSRDRPPSSPASHESSDSPSSLMSLVDVSRVNGNNSDTSDSSDNDVHTVMGRTNPNTEESPKTSESSHLKAIKIHQRPLPAIPDEANPLPSGQKDETNDSKDQNKNKEASPEATAFYEGSVENDFSMSVFSLKFRHIKRPISPTERKAKTDLHYTSSFSSTCTYRPRKTLIQECVSRHSFQDDESNSCSSSQCGRDSESQCGRDSEEGNADTIEPLQSISKEIYEDNDKEKEKEQLTDAQKYSKSRNTPHNLKLLYSSKTCTHKTKTTLAETEETLPSTFMHPSREQTSSNLNPEQSPEPKPQKRRYLPVTRLSKCDALPDTPYSRKGKALSKTHSARCSLRATDTGSGGQRREAGEPVFKAATGEWGTGKAEREEKATILRRINQIQSAMSGGKSKAAGKDATHNVDEIKTDERLV